ncbi:MAG: stage 0 sporulation family protein [Clostridium argentinense]|uniref:Stage 0 sporulation family protein n=1 Tax=Clostridium faecium TaxID=2762223 RepID=A0ABR8YVY7_9CLOT|nr:MULTISPECIES: stage 0 sporulation family protein [Clostridium]MBD8048453.1 stage 0 sporulation family protein [Clostridium faecium]MBS5823439.1 stage 0 sporulation family protein [Clostridium argentinense]
MVTVIGVRFKKAGKIYYFNPSDLDIKKGDFVVVETARGVEFGECVIGMKNISEEEIVSPLKNVIRKAEPEDIEKNNENKQKEKEAYDICVEKISKHGLDMKLIDVEYTFDNNKVIFYFTADGRVDFRELVKDLASIFRTRIELRQIGVRDEAKMTGGLGPCGRTLCCSTFLGEFVPVSIKMAKEQNLSLNPTKISGICGRLMCCLNYEQDIYEDIRKKLPKVGSIVNTPYGEGEVMSNSVIKESVKVKVKLKDGEDELKVVKIEDLTLISGSYEDIINDVDIKELEGEIEDPDMIKELFKEN